MSKPKPTPTKSAVAPAPAPPAAGWARGLRETVEAVVTAFILAFLFRTFEAEAFVIPTGSMAPTLQGRHKDIECPQCHYEYRVSASQEVDSDTGSSRNCDLIKVTCPMCRFALNVNPREPGNKSQYPSYSGDRIIVNKFAYDVSSPQRWDVVVFKYPEDAKTNYIKRLVGVPNERLRIVSGDIYTAPLGSNDFQIVRKPSDKLRAMLQPVYDNDYVVAELIQAGVPPRWQPWAAPGQASAWKSSDDLKSFEGSGQSPEPDWLRYQNIVPKYDTWEDVLDGKRPSPLGPSPVTDFYAFNEGEFSCRTPQDRPHWVGDLALDFTLDVNSDRGAVTLELVKGGRQFRCRIDLATGEAKLSISDQPEFATLAQTPIVGAGSYTVSFANVDQQLLLWVNGETIQFNAPTTYQLQDDPSPVETRPVPGATKATDLSPAGIAVEGGAAVALSHLAIWRDIYYIADPGPGVGFAQEPDRSRIIDLQAEQYFMLGDNSPQSKDSRYWSGEKFVDRRLLIGKALFIYWPHSFNYIEVVGRRIPFPFWPNFARMRFVH